MDEKIRRRIEEIVNGMSCPRDFICARSGFEVLCSADEIGMDSFLVCLDEEIEGCKFRLRFGTSHYCSCPLRVYLAKHLND